MKKTISVIFLLFIFFYLPAQQNTIDSLHQLLATAKEDTTRINLLNRLSRVFTDSKPDSALIYANDALLSAEKIGYSNGEITALRYKSVVLMITANYSQALEIGLTVLK